jgi:hypothetical protein
MKNSKFENTDAGYYSFDTEESDERWAITHPTEGYLPNESNQYDMYIHNLSNNNEYKFLGSLPSFEQCEIVLNYFISQNYKYEDLKGETIKSF